MAESYSVEAVLSVVDKGFKSGVGNAMRVAAALADDSDRASASVGGLGKSLLSANLATAAITSGLSAVSSAIKGVFSEALSQGAAMEQSFGGIETLYGDAAGQAKEYANAAALAGISANTYAEQAVSFGASLKQALGGDAVAAAKAADKAIMAMADNSAKMGTDISSVQQTFQGFAKQNYTMLDNLKLGYGGTKTEMQRLLKDASKLEGAMGREFDIENFADIVDAIQLVQEELGVAGVAAKEAESTLSGSAAAVKASFANVIGNIAIGEDFGQSLQQLSVTTSNFLFKNFIPMVGRIFKALPGAVSTFVKSAMPEIQGQIQSIFSGIGIGGPVFDKFAQGFQNFARLFQFAFMDAKDAATEFLGGFSKTPAIQSVATAFHEVSVAALDLSEKLAGAIPFDKIGEMAGKAVTFVADMATRIAKFSQSTDGSIFRGLLVGILGALAGLKTLRTGMGIFNKFKSFNPFAKIGESGGAVSSFAQNTKAIFTGLGNTIKSLGTGIAAASKGIGAGLSTAFKGAGAAIAMLNPAQIGMVAVAILAVGAALALMGTQGTGIATIVQTVGTAMGTVVQSIGTAVATITTSFATLVPAITPIVSILTAGFVQIASIVVQSIPQIVAAMAPFIPHVTDLVATVTPLLSEIVGAFTNLVNQVAPILERLDNILGTFNETLRTVFDGAQGIIESFGSAVSGVLDSVAGIFDSIGYAALNAGRGFKSLAQGVVMITNTKLSDMVASLGAVATGTAAIAVTGPGLAIAGAGMTALATGMMVFGQSATTLQMAMQVLPTALAGFGASLAVLPLALMATQAAMVTFALSAVTSASVLPAMTSASGLLVSAANGADKALSSAQSTFARFGGEAQQASSVLSRLGVTATITASQMLRMGVMVATAMTNSASAVSSGGTRMVVATQATMSQIKSVVSNGMASVVSSIRSGSSQMLSAWQSAGNQMVARTQSFVTSTNASLARVGSGVNLQANGSALMAGLKSGIDDGWSKITASVSTMAQWIKDNKGPVSYDRRLLVDNGFAIMYGLDRGISSGWEDVKDRVSGMAGDLANLVKPGAFDLGYLADLNGSMAYETSSTQTWDTSNHNAGIISKLDELLTAIENGSVIVMDGREVGRVTDRRLGQNTQLRSRTSWRN